MNKEDIIRMAQEAGAEFAELPRGDAWLFTNDECLERFAALVASAEREACADTVDKVAIERNASKEQRLALHVAADAIRARGQA